MNKKNVYGGILIAIIIATVSFLISLKEPNTIVGSQGLQGLQGEQGPQGPAGRDGKDGKDGKDAPVKLGGVSGPDTYFSYVANNNLQEYGETKGFTTATTTVCAIKSPAATSTLVFAGVNFTVSSSTASLVTLAKATTAYATSTALNTLTLAANAQGAQIATSSTATVGVVGNNIFSPNTYFVVGMQDTTPQAGAGTFSPVGSCSARFLRI